MELRFRVEEFCIERGFPEGQISAIEESTVPHCSMAGCKHGFILILLTISAGMVVDSGKRNSIYIA